MNERKGCRSARIIVLGVLAMALTLSCQNNFINDIKNSDVTSIQSSRAITADLRTPSIDPPGGLTPAKVPQFIILGYDDNQYADGMQAVLNVYKNKNNPAGANNPLTYDGAPAHVSFYVTPGGRDDATGETWAVEADTINSWKVAYQGGHEIGNHTYFHGHGLQYTQAQWLEEMNKCTDFIVANVGLPRSEIVGFRTPFLEYNPATFAALKQAGLIYDVSYEGGWSYWPAQTGSTLSWPYTMDNGKPAGEDGRDFGREPGIWEIPDDCIFFSDGTRTTGLDYNLWFAKQTTKDQFVAALKYSLDKKYTGNRSPMNFGLHSNYYSLAGEEDMKKYDAASYARLKANLAERQAALAEFLAYALTLPDVRIVSAKEALQWIKNPVPLGPSAITQYAITSSADGHGSIAPSGVQNIIAGTNKTYYFNADPGYLLDSVVVDGVNKGTISSYTFTNVAATHTISVTFKTPSLENRRKSSILSMTNIAENSQTSFAWNYAENINDGRGITFGIVGFTSGTYDGTILINRVKELEPGNLLASYLPAFQAIDASPHIGDKTANVTGLSNFIRDFGLHGGDAIVQKAQLEKLDELYYNVAYAKYLEIGGTKPITLAFLYDTVVNHGAEGEGIDKGLKTLVNETNTAMNGTPKTGVNEISWLTKLLDVRKAYMMSDPAWADALDRIEMFRRLLTTGNTAMSNPFTVSCYGENFTIYGTEIILPEPGIQFSITANAASNGTISPEGVFTVNEGSGIQYMITANSGYEIADVSVNGMSVGAVSTYVFSNVKANQTISATFKPTSVTTYTLTASASGNGSISPSGAIAVTGGSSKLFSIAAAAGYKIAAVLIDGVSIGPVASYTFVTITASHTIEASFVIDGVVPCVYPVFESAKIYYNGDIVHYNAHNWKAGWWTQNAVPGTTGEWGVWKDLGICTNGKY